MAKQPIAEKALYEQEEQQIQEKSDAFIRILTQRGILGNDQIKDERIRQAQQEKQRRMYHNTRLLLEQYRNIAWALECFPDTIAAELDHPLGDLDSLLGKMDLEMGLGNRKLESRLESVKKSRLLLDRVNEALTVLKRKPDNGPKMYELIYQTYLAPEKLSHADLLYRLDISSRHYYRLRQQAITILSIRLQRSFKLVPGPVEKTVQFTTGVSADHWDAESGNELCQGAAAAFFDGVMDSFIGFLTESVRADDFIPELIQLIEITEILHPAMANEFFQRDRR